MQRPTENNELSKGRCATCKGRMSVMLCGYMYMHAYIQCSRLIAYQYVATYIVTLNSLTEVIAICDDIIVVLIVGLRNIEGCTVG